MAHSRGGGALDGFSGSGSFHLSTSANIFSTISGINSGCNRMQRGCRIILDTIHEFTATILFIASFLPSHSHDNHNHYHISSISILHDFASTHYLVSSNISSNVSSNIPFHHPSDRRPITLSSHPIIDPSHQASPQKDFSPPSGKTPAPQN